MDIEIPGYGLVEFPDTMSEKEVADAAERLYDEWRQGQQVSREAIEQTLADMPWHERALVGLGKSFLETYEGGRQLLGFDPNPENVAALEAGTNMPLNSGTTPGYIAGEIAQLALPVGYGIKAAKALGMAPKLAALVGDVGLSAAQGATKLPTGDASRLGGAAEGAAGAVLGAGLGEGAEWALGKTPVPGALDKWMRRRFQPEFEPGAQEMMDQGVRLSPGQAFNGDVRLWEDANKNMPGVGRDIRRAQRRGIEDWNRMMLQDAAPSNAQSVDDYLVGLPRSPQVVDQAQQIGREGIRDIANQFDDAYRQLDEALEVDPADMPPVHTALESSYDELEPLLSPEATSELKREVDFLKTQLGTEEGAAFTGSNLTQLHKRLGKLQQAAANRSDINLADAYGEVQKALDESLHIAGDAIDTYHQRRVLNAQYSRFVPLQIAAARIGSDKGVFTPRQAMSALRENDKSLRKAAYARGNLVNQDAIEGAQDLFGASLPDPGPGTAEKLTLGTPASYLAAQLQAPVNQRIYNYRQWQMDPSMPNPNQPVLRSQAVEPFLQQEGTPQPILNSEQVRRLDSAIAFASNLGAENVGRTLQTVKRRVERGTATEEDVERAQETLSEAYARARQGGNEELANRIQGFYLDTTSVYFPE